MRLTKLREFFGGLDVCVVEWILLFHIFQQLTIAYREKFDADLAKDVAAPDPALASTVRVTVALALANDSLGLRPNGPGSDRKRAGGVAARLSLVLF